MKNVPAKIALSCLIAVITAVYEQDSQAADQRQFDLRPSDAHQTREVRATVEISGELKLNPDGKQVTRLPLKVSAVMHYDEQTLPEQEEASRAVRFYREAKADIKIGGKTITNQLGNDARYALAVCNQHRPAILATKRPLSRDELDLIDIPGNTIGLPGLLPRKEVAIGTSWDADPAVMAGLIGIDAISEGEIKCTFHDVQNRLAIVHLTGVVKGVAAGVATEIELNAKYNFHLDQHQITWFTAAIKEDRAIGHAQPGVQAITRLKVIVEPTTDPESLRRAQVEGLNLTVSPGAELLQATPAPGGFRFLHDRRWRVMTDRHDVVIYRMIDRGDLIGQFNLSKPVALSAGKQMQLEEFQDEVRRVLKDKDGQLVEASQSTTDTGLRILRVLATGKVSDLPIRWIYYHVANEAGDRITGVFTHEEELGERFGDADQTIIPSIEFINSKTVLKSAVRTEVAAKPLVAAQPKVAEPEFTDRPTEPTVEPKVTEKPRQVDDTPAPQLSKPAETTPQPTPDPNGKTAVEIPLEERVADELRHDLRPLRDRLRRAK